MTTLQHLGQFQIEAYHGSNRYVDIYRAADSVRKRTVALKVLKPRLSEDTLLATRLVARAQTAADLVHPHIAWVWETGEYDGMFYIAERYISGPSLASILTDSGPIPWEQSLQIMRHVTQALGFAHDKNWVHGNVTPGKIVLSPELGAVLTDFGLMNALQSSTLPEAYKPIQAALYSGPEIWRGQPATQATDQYALACVFAECLTGLPLFGAPTDEEMRNKHLASLELSQNEISTLPWQIIPVLRKALTLNPEERYKSIGEFIDAPIKLAATAGEEPEELEQREAEALAWREAAERARKASEDAERKAAVEQARREIEEQLRKDSQLSETITTPEADFLAEPTEIKLKPRAERRMKKRTPLGRNFLWIATAAVLTVIVIAVILGTVIGAGNQAQPTTTPTQHPATMLFTATMTVKPSDTDAPSPTPSPSVTASPISSGTPTTPATASYTPSPSATPITTPTHTPTMTRTPKLDGPSTSIRGEPAPP